MRALHVRQLFARGHAFPFNPIQSHLIPINVEVRDPTTCCLLKKIKNLSMEQN